MADERPGVEAGPAREHDACHARLLDALRQPVALIDASGRIISANRAMTAVLGRDPAALHGQSLPGFLCEGNRDEGRAEQHFDPTSIGSDSRQRFQRPDGSTIDVQLRVTPVSPDAGATTFLVECSGAGDRVERDAELAKALAEVSTLLSVIPAPIVVIDDRRRIASVNRAAEEIFGWSEAELIDREVTVLLEPGQSLSPGAAERGGDGASGRWSSGARRTLHVRRRDGTTFPADVAVREVPMRPGGRRRFVATLEDLSARAQAEAQLVQAQRTEALARLVAGVAHDFNNLLSVIGGSIELARGHDPEADRWLDRAETAADRAASIIRQLLQYARREPGEQAPVDLVALAETTVNLLCETVDRRIAIEVQAPHPVPAVMANDSQVEQVLMNLVMNACDAIVERFDVDGADAIGGGRVTVSLEQRSGDDGRSLVVLGVRDNGAGIPPDVIDRVLDPFFTTKSEGTGLGLSTSFGIVRSHGGTLDVFSEPGVGTLFEVALPAAEPGAVTTIDDDGQGDEALPLPRAVLVVDDEEDVLAITSRMLQDAGCVVATVRDGFAAVDAARARNFDVVLLDVNMPGPGGWTVLDWLLASRPEQAVLMMSGFGSEAEARVRGALGMLAKPFDSAALLRALRRTMASRGRRGTPSR